MRLNRHFPDAIVGQVVAVPNESGPRPATRNIFRLDELGSVSSITLHTLFRKTALTGYAAYLDFFDSESKRAGWIFLYDHGLAVVDVIIS